jgi:hypothetical protein
LIPQVVDSALEVVDAFHEKLLELERDILIKPNMKVVARRESCFAKFNSLQDLYP